MSSLTVDTLTNQNSQLCKAWVTFDGTGTVSVDDSYNVSSITDSGAGLYEINFIQSMTNADYSWSGSNGGTNTSNNFVIQGQGTPEPTTGSLPIAASNGGDSTVIYADASRICVQIFGN